MPDLSTTPVNAAIANTCPTSCFNSHAPNSHENAAQRRDMIERKIQKILHLHREISIAGPLPADVFHQDAGSSYDTATWALISALNAARVSSIMVLNAERDRMKLNWVRQGHNGN